MNRYALGLCSTFTLPCLSLFSDSPTMQIPEGKLQDHASLFGEITPSAGPRVIDGVGLCLTGDYIYWTAREEGLDFAISGVDPSGAAVAGKGHRIDPRFRFKSGFKAGLGFAFGHDKWDLLLGYTWLNSLDNHKAVYSTNSYPLSNLIPVSQSGGESYSAINSGRARWHLNFNTLDISLGRNLYLSKFLSVRPFFGMKGALIKQRLSLSYDFTNGLSLLSKNKNTFTGLGLFSGVNTTWHLAGTWSLYGDGALSLVWGDFMIKRQDRNTVSSAILYNTDGGFHTVKPALELSFGLRKEVWIYHDRLHIAWQAGWEQQVWFSQNQFDFYTAQAQGDLTLQGFTTKLRFDF
jgi:hypothetical protein